MNQQLLNILGNYADLSDSDAAAALSVPTVSTRPYYVSYRTLASVDLGAADAVMGALRQSHPDLATLMLQSGATDGTAGGVDVSLPATRAMIDQFVAGGIISQQQGDAIKAMAEVSTYPAGEPVTAQQVADARKVLAAQAKAIARRKSLADAYNSAIGEVETFEAQIAAGTVPEIAPWE